MVGIMDLNDEKENIEDLERDRQVYTELLQRANMKIEMLQETVDNYAAEARRLQLMIEQIDQKIIKLKEKKEKSE